MPLCSPSPAPKASQPTFHTSPRVLAVHPKHRLLGFPALGSATFPRHPRLLIEGCHLGLFWALMMRCRVPLLVSCAALSWPGWWSYQMVHLSSTNYEQRLQPRGRSYGRVSKGLGRKTRPSSGSVRARALSVVASSRAFTSNDNLPGHVLALPFHRPSHRRSPGVNSSTVSRIASAVVHRPS